MIDIDMLIEKIDDHDYGDWPEGPNAGDLGDFAHKAKSAMSEFVKRCEEGSVRSTYTYNLFKKVLEIE